MQNCNYFCTKLIFPLVINYSWLSLFTARRSNQSILNEISPEYSLEGLMLKLKLQYFGHLIQRADSLEKPWCWERLKAGEGDNREWDGWMASPTWWTWVWVGSWSCWWTGKPGRLQSMGSQRVRHEWATVLKIIYYDKNNNDKIDTKGMIKWSLKSMGLIHSLHFKNLTSF